jgi:MFS family permease
MFAFGALVGMYGLTAVADVLGRRAAINISLLIQFIAGCALISGIYINIIFLMMFGHFLSGVFASGLTIISFVYSGEICGNKMRQIGIMMYCSTWYDLWVI